MAPASDSTRRRLVHSPPAVSGASVAHALAGNPYHSSLAGSSTPTPVNQAWARAASSGPAAT